MINSKWSHEADYIDNNNNNNKENRIKMMSFNQWVLLWLLFVSYLLLGSLMFYLTERKHEENKLAQENPQLLDFEELLNKYYTWSNRRAHFQLLLKLREHCNSSIMSNNNAFINDDEVYSNSDEYQWTFYNSFFFALTTLSTIGYGNLHPTSSLGRMLVILYSLFGIPLNGIVLTQLGEFFGSVFLKVHERYKGKRFETRFILIVDIVMYLIPGFFIFIILPSGMFVYFEGWTFEESIYFAYVSLTTIGYGDYVAAQTTRNTDWYNLYKVILVFWMMFGLGYLVMILGFISRAMRSKKMAKLEHKVVRNLKYTHSKICNGFAKDILYVRTLLNELYLMKFKPVYKNKESIAIKVRSQSLPDLSRWTCNNTRTFFGNESSSDEEYANEDEVKLMFEKQKMKRRKGLSENVLNHYEIKTRSDGDLSEIDKNATFAMASSVEPNHLLAKVVDALGTTYGISSSSSSSSSEDECEPQRINYYEKGVNGLTNSQILMTEGDVSNSYKNSFTFTSNGEQWTWNGFEASGNITRANGGSRFNESTNEANKRCSLPFNNRIRRMSNAARNFISSGLKSNNENSKIMQDNNKKQKRKLGKSLLSNEGRKKERYSLCDFEYETMCHYINYLTQTRAKQASVVNMLKKQIVELGADRNNVFQETNTEQLKRILENLRKVSTDDKKCSLFSLFPENKTSTDAEKNVLERPRFSSYAGIEINSPSRHSSIFPSRYYSSVTSDVSKNHKRLSDLRAKERTNSNPSLSIPQIRRLRNDSINKSKIDIAPEKVVKSRRIRRFSVRPAAIEESSSSRIERRSNDNINRKDLRRFSNDVKSQDDIMDSLQQVVVRQP